MEIKGKITSIEPITRGVSKAGKDWQKQLFVIETMEQYPRKVAIEVMNAKVDDFGSYKVGHEITCGINIESREYNGKYYTTVQAWKLAGSSNNSQSEEPFNSSHEPTNGDSSTDDLPF